MSMVHYFKRGQKLANLGLKASKLRKSNSPQASAALIAQMASLRGLPQKLGQILSLKNLDQDSNPFLELTESHCGMPFEQALGLIEQELSGPIGDTFRQIDQRAFAASLGQVHRAQLIDGSEVAIKIQYPDTLESLEVDLKAIGIIAAPLSSQASGFNLDSYRSELKESIIKELNYTLEATTLSRFTNYFANLDQYKIPSPIRSLCTKKMLVMEWIEGVPLTKLLDQPLQERQEAASLLLRFFLLSWLKHGEIHADPHSGNFRIIKTETGVIQLGVLDLGCTKLLNSFERNALQNLLQSPQELSPEQILSLLVTLGFDESLLYPMQPKLPELLAALLEPFQKEGVFEIANWNLTDRINIVLGEDRWNFRFAGPASLMHFIRALTGTIQYLKALQVDLNWKAELDRVLADIPAAKNFVNNRAKRREGGSFENPTNALSSVFCIEVKESRKTKAKLRFQIKSLINLGSIMPPDLLEKIQKTGVFPQKLADRAISDNYPPGDLFCYNDNDKTIRVWLE